MSKNSKEARKCIFCNKKTFLNPCCFQCGLDIDKLNMSADDITVDSLNGLYPEKKVIDVPEGTLYLPMRYVEDFDKSNSLKDFLSGDC